MPSLVNGAVGLVAAVLYLCAAVIDLRAFRIPNWVSLSLLGLFIGFAVWGGLQDWPGHVVVAAAATPILVFSYANRYLGGGDFKLMFVTFLWAGPTGALPALLVMLGVAILQFGLAHYGFSRTKTDHQTIKHAFAPAIAAGGFISLYFALFT